MRDRRSCATGTLGAIAILLACLGPASAEGNQLIATVDRPAVVTAAAGPGPELGSADQPARVVISVRAFTPPRDGVVQAAVRVQKNDGGAEQEIGRFGIFPNAEFTAAEPSQARRYSFPLPRELASGGPVKVKVQLLPLRGDGKDARLEIGGAEIR